MELLSHAEGHVAAMIIQQVICNESAGVYREVHTSWYDVSVLVDSNMGNSFTTTAVYSVLKNQGYNHVHRQLSSTGLNLERNIRAQVHRLEQ